MNNAIDAPDGLLVGRPVFTSENLPNIGASPQNDSIYCGDFKQASELVQIGPMSILRDPFSTHGKTTFYISQRFGGRLTDNVKDQLDDMATQINALPERMPTTEPVDLSPLQVSISRMTSSMDSLRSYVGNLLNAVENINIVMPESPASEKPSTWTATVTKRNAGGGIKEVTFDAG